MGEVRHPFEMPVPDPVWALSSLFAERGFRLYVVGGAVRDALLGQVPSDYDLVTDARPEQVCKALEGSFWTTSEVGKSFGIVIARLRRPGSGESVGPYDIATFRRDVGEGRRPMAVEFTTIDEDVKRRDLTCNALFYDLQAREVVDLVGGLADLGSRVVRAVGNPADRFREDPLRVLRAIRFAAKLDWFIEPETWRAMCANRGLFGVSSDRIHEELTRALEGARSANSVLDMLFAAELWPQVLPGLRVHQRPVRSRKLSVIVAVLLDEHDERFVEKMLREARYSDLEVRQVTFLTRFWRELSVEQAFGLRRGLHAAQLTFEEAKDVALRRGHGEASWLLAAFGRYLATPPINGSDLMAEGYSGKELGLELQRREAETFRGLL